eukprot:m.271061 g.271061  ORF g.271061 m.271061 type:complete len:98 (+) comp93352_c0_seq1:73-366(+)
MNTQTQQAKINTQTSTPTHKHANTPTHKHTNKHQQIPTPNRQHINTSTHKHTNINTQSWGRQTQLGTHSDNQSLTLAPSLNHSITCALLLTCDLLTQ